MGERIVAVLAASRLSSTVIAIHRFMRAKHNGRDIAERVDETGLSLFQVSTTAARIGKRTYQGCSPTGLRCIRVVAMFSMSEVP